MVSMVILSGCNGSLYSSGGTAKSQPINLIQLQAGHHHGTWKTNELALNYDYQMTPETLKISGTVNLVGGFALCCNTVKRLVVRLVFLDNQETVIKTEFFYSPNNNHPISLLPMNFDRTVPVPSGTSSISFDYDGELISGGGGATSVSIWYSPS